MKTLKRFVLVGGPASGKGTQARYLAQAFGLHTLSTGALLRQEIEACSDLGRQAQSFMDRAMLVPDEVVNDIVRGWLSNNDETPWLLDGYPRTVAQAETLDSFMRERGLGVDVVVWLDVARELIEARMLKRKECTKCGLITRDGEMVCPDCGSGMRVRADDNLEAFARRWQDYEALTVPVANYYEAKGLAVRVRVTEEGEPEEVSLRISQKLKEFAE